MKIPLLLAAGIILALILLHQPLCAQQPIEHPQQIPAWQVAAGGKAEFEVASIREDLSYKFSSPPFSIDSDDNYMSTHGIFNAEMPLTSYISFAYKLDQQHNMLMHLPKWASTTAFVIQARAAGDPTKDQLRLMMQSLLAERFKLELHFDQQEMPVIAMTLLKPERFGPRLHLHTDGPACDVAVPDALNSEIFPNQCDLYLALNKPNHAMLAGARNTTPRLMAAFFSNVGRQGRTVVDQTGIVGNIDFSMLFVPEPGTMGQPAGLDPAEVQGETFLEAVKDQLGLKLEPAKAILNIPVVDHVEMPSGN